MYNFELWNALVISELLVFLGAIAEGKQGGQPKLDTFIKKGAKEMRGRPLTQEDWDKVRLLDSKRVFTTQQLANITDLSIATINNIKQYASFEEYQAVRLGAMKLNAKRKAEREREAKEAYESAQRELSGEDAFDNGVKLDIIIEKLDTIIKLFSEDVANRIGTTYQSNTTYNSNNKAPF